MQLRDYFQRVAFWGRGRIDLDIGVRRGTVYVMHLMDSVGHDRSSGPFTTSRFGGWSGYAKALHSSRGFVYLFACFRSIIEDQETAEGGGKNTPTHTSEMHSRTLTPIGCWLLGGSQNTRGRRFLGVNEYTKKLRG